MKIAFIEQFKEKLRSDEHFAEIIRGSGIAFFLKILGLVLSYLFTLVVTRTLGAKAWGIFALCLVILQIASVVGRLGMDTALLRFTAECIVKNRPDVLDDIYKKALKLIIPVSLIVALGVYFLSSTLAVIVFRKPFLTFYFRITSFAVVPFVLLMFHSECIRGLKKIKQYMLLQQTGTFGLSLMAFILGIFLVDKKVYLPILVYVSTIIVLSIIAFLLWRRYLSYFSKKSIVRKSEVFFTYKMLISTSIPMLLSNSLVLIMGWIDTIMLGIFRSAQDVGIYNVALKLSMIIGVVLAAVNTIVAPKFAEFWGKNDISKLAVAARQATKIILFFSLPILMLFLLFPNHILSIFGESFSKVSNILIILAIGQFINVMVGSVGNILLMTGKERVFQNFLLFGVVINIVLSLLLIPYLGIEGAAIASSTSLAFWNIAALIYIRLTYGFWTIPFLGGLNE